MYMSISYEKKGDVHVAVQVEGVAMKRILVDLPEAECVRIGEMTKEYLDRSRRQTEAAQAQWFPHNPLTHRGMEPVATWPPGKVIAYSSALKRVNLSPKDVIARFGDWVVTVGGMDCLSTCYWLECKQLWQHDNSGYSWERHMGEKVWVNMPNFLAAFEYAREYHRRSKP